MTRLRGLSAFPITPMSPEGRVEADGLRRLLGRLVDARVDSIGLLGSTGSYPYLAREERRRATEIAMEAVGGRAPILVGVGALRTDDAVALARDAREAGAAAGLLAAVSYTPLTDDEVFEHVSTVARESCLRICIYDNPGTTHFTFSAALVGRLSRLPGIVAVKSPAPAASGVPAHLAGLRAVVPADFPLGYSVDWHAVEALLAGGEAWYSVLAGLFPEPCLAILRAVQAGDATEAQRLDAALEPLWALFREFSSLRVVYAAANLIGLTSAEPPRPILPLGEPARRRVAETLERLALR